MGFLSEMGAVTPENRKNKRRSKKSKLFINKKSSNIKQKKRTYKLNFIFLEKVSTHLLTVLTDGAIIPHVNGRKPKGAADGRKSESRAEAENLPRQSK